MIKINDKEYPCVDLGSGEEFQPDTDIGVDRYEYNDKIKVCNIGFERLPFDDNSVGRFTAKDFLEHLPTTSQGVISIATLKNDMADSHKFQLELQTLWPIIFLFNEVWRCLVPGGEFFSVTPVYPCQEVWQDPTHVSVWTMNTMDYFCGGYGRLPEAYGIKCKFIKIINEQEGFHLHALLRKPL